MHKQTILYLAPANSVHTQKWVCAIAEDFDIYLITLHEVTIKVPDSVKIHRYKKSLLGLLSCIILMNYLSITRKIKFIHAHYASSYGFLSALTIQSVKIVSVWGSDIYEFPRKSLLHRQLLKFNLWRADYITSTSNAMAAEARNYVNKDIVVIPFGIDMSVFFASKEKLKSKTFRVGTIKSLEHKYGIDVFIDAISHIKIFYPQEYRHLEIEIYGHGSQHEELADKIRKLCLDDKVKLCGKVPHISVPEKLKSFDLFVALSRTESFGVSVVEAMACGIVPLVTNVGGLPEVVGDEEASYIVESEDYKAAASCIIHAFNNKNKLLRMSDEAIRRVRLHYNFMENLKEMRKLYTKVSAGG